MNELKNVFLPTEERDEALPLLVTGIGLRYNQTAVVRESGYQFYHIFRCVSGQGHVEAGGRVFALRENMAMLLYSNEPHRYHPEKAPWVVDWVTFQCAQPLLSYLCFEHSAAFELAAPELLTAELRGMGERLRWQLPTTKASLSCRLFSALIELSRSAAAGGGMPWEARYKKLEPVLRHIELNLGSVLTLEQLAGQAEVSCQYLCALFQELLHMRPFQYINSLRISRSSQMLLEDRRRPVAEIAAECGFENVCYFNQSFKKRTGMSPSGFRALH